MRAAHGPVEVLLDRILRGLRNNFQPVTHYRPHVR